VIRECCFLWCASYYFSLLLLRKEYCSVEVPFTDVQTQLPWDKIIALIFYIELSSLWRSLVRRKMACCHKLEPAAFSYFGPNTSFGPLQENEEEPFVLNF
jgi:hypothetical protein